jgi:hypothetical protein
VNLTNIQRDTFLIADMLQSSRLSWPATAFVYNSDGTVHPDHHSARADSGAVPSASAHYIGVNMSPPTLDRIPYRVKAYVEADIESYILLGYAPATITGSGDSPAQSTLIPFNGCFDEIIMIHEHDSTHAYYERPIVFGVGVLNQSGNVIRANISVQNLSTAPPPFAMGVS